MIFVSIDDDILTQHFGFCGFLDCLRPTNIKNTK